MPIPFEFAGKVYREAEVREPTAGLLADTRKGAEGGNYFAALAIFAGGAMVSCGEEHDPKQLKILAREMPYLSAEAVAIASMIAADVDDSIDTVWSCPRCGAKVSPPEGSKIGDLPVECADEPVVVEHVLESPVSIERSDGEGTLVEASSLIVRVPSLGNYIKAFARYGTADPVRVEFAALVESTVSVDGVAVERSWVSSLGMVVFNAMKSRDVRAIDAKIKAFGRQNRMPVSCGSCGKEWSAEVNAASFFVSGLAQR